MVTVNVVVLAGRLSDVPEVKEMPSGDHVTRFRLHVPDPGKRVLPLPVSAWDRLARKGCDGLVKGDAVLVRGQRQGAARTGRELSRRARNAAVRDHLASTCRIRAVSDSQSRSF